MRGEDFFQAFSLADSLETPPRAWGRHQYIVKELYLNTTYWDY